jgi:hypothetical protein
MTNLLAVLFALEFLGFASQLCHFLQIRLWESSFGTFCDAPVYRAAKQRY